MDLHTDELFTGFLYGIDCLDKYTYVNNSLMTYSEAVDIADNYLKKCQKEYTKRTGIKIGSKRRKDKMKETSQDYISRRYDMEKGKYKEHTYLLRAEFSSLIASQNYVDWFKDNQVEDIKF
uniref:Uncharacterized protein n=1 Tax=Pithovirus LCPAC403 TaxID=2506596 RepID=A0A481ZD21_9VIRU|nr:MAG: hypothetical protein LCPAC403_00930 [Pithovirus LCPAC403]